MKAVQIFFNQNECKALGIALANMLEDLKFSDGMNFNPQAQKDFRDIGDAALSAASKLQKFAGIKTDLPEYNPGDENEFLNQN